MLEGLQHVGSSFFFMKVSNIVNRFINVLFKYGYTIEKSRISPGHSYYFKYKNNLTIRLSDHYLHPNQEIYNMINVVYHNDELSVNGKFIVLKKNSAKIICNIAMERIKLECKLYGKPMP